MKNCGCPRCNAEALSENGVCANCNYVHKIMCTECGHNNKASSKFCGVCGASLNFKTLLRQKLYKLLPYDIRTKLRHFATGLAFGTLLALFAFGALP